MVNPAWVLVHLLADLKGSDGIVRVPGFYDKVRNPTPAEVGALEAYVGQATGGDDKSTSVVGPIGVNELRKLSFEPTLNIAGLAAGYQGSGIKTIVPGWASVKLDVRLVPDQDPDEVLESLTGIVDRVGRKWSESGLTLSVEVSKSVKPAKCPIDHPFAVAVAEAVQEAFGAAPLRLPIGKGSGPASILQDALGLPFLMISCAPHDASMHGPNESIEISDFTQNAYMSALVLKQASTLSRS